jgi:hypothetical protein
MDCEYGGTLLVNCTNDTASYYRRLDSISTVRETYTLYFNVRTLHVVEITNTMH